MPLFRLKLFTQAGRQRNIAELKSAGVDVSSWIGEDLSLNRIEEEIYSPSFPGNVLANNQPSQSLQQLANNVVNHFNTKMKIVHPRVKKLTAVLDGLRLYKKYKGKRGAVLWENHVQRWERLKHWESNRFAEKIDNNLVVSNTKRDLLWAIIEHIVVRILRILNELEINVIVAPFEADSQLVKLVELKVIECVISQDKDFVFYMVPLVVDLQPNGNCKVIDLKTLTSIEVTGMNFWLSQVVKILQKSSLEMRAVFAMLNGCSYMIKPDLDREDVVNIVKNSNSMKDAMQKIQKDHPEVYSPKFKRQFREAVLTFQLSSWYNPETNDVQFFDKELADRLVKVEKVESSYINGLAKPDQTYSQSERKGLVNRFTKLPRDILPIFGRKLSVTEKLKQLCEHKEWISIGPKQMQKWSDLFIYTGKKNITLRNSQEERIKH